MAGVKLEQLQLATIGVVDSRIEAMFQKHVQNIVHDCMNRPGEKTKRKLVLEFDIVPVVEADQDTGEVTCDEVKVQFKGRSKVPEYRTRAYPMKLSKAGLLFNREVPEDLHQPSLYDEDEREE